MKHLLKSIIYLILSCFTFGGTSEKFKKKYYQKRIRYKNKKFRKDYGSYASFAYAQEGEDLLIAAYYEGKEKYNGFYLDIGAYDPINFSNTHKWYERGWRGINIDATPGSMLKFMKQRPEDINLELGIGPTKGTVQYYSFVGSALNSFDKELSEARIANGQQLKEIVDVRVENINDILKNYLPEGQKIDFVSIDIEGFEIQVLKDFDFEKYSPSFFLIEQLEYGMKDFTEINKSEVYQLLKNVDYSPVAKTQRTVLYKHKDFV